MNKDKSVMISIDNKLGLMLIDVNNMFFSAYLKPFIIENDIVAFDIEGIYYATPDDEFEFLPDNVTITFEGFNSINRTAEFSLINMKIFHIYELPFEYDELIMWLEEMIEEIKIALPDNNEIKKEWI